ncbi:MAG TPA: hypothetical protein VIM98_02780 [Dyella sp.]|uniref:hypothetical protein n=1 Tax=Dyella sp. TaxID=1869338 RepID=UPI002F92E40D
MAQDGQRLRLRAPSAIEMGMLAVAITLGILGCSSKSDALRTARYDPLNLYYDDSLRKHVIAACHQGTATQVNGFEQLPACRLANYEEQLKRSGWKPPGLGQRHPSGTAMR